MNTILAKVKQALRVTTNDFDVEITDIINACLLDLGIAGVTENDTTNALIIRAVCTYAKFHFGTIADADYQNLKKSYDEQKAQMMTATGYTEWGNE